MSNVSDVRDLTILVVKIRAFGNKKWEKIHEDLNRLNELIYEEFNKPVFDLALNRRLRSKSQTKLDEIHRFMEVNPDWEKRVEKKMKARKV